MNVKRLRNLVLEIFKTLNHLNPKYMKKYFYETAKCTHRPFNIKVNQNNTIKYDNKILRRLGHHSRTSLPMKFKEKND